MKVLHSLLTIVLLSHVNGAEASIDDILNFLFGPLLRLVAQPTCDRGFELLDLDNLLPWTLDCQCSGRFQGLRITGVISCAIDSGRACFFSSSQSPTGLACGDVNGGEAVIRPSVLQGWSWSGTVSITDVDYTGVSEGVAESHRRIDMEMELKRGFSVEVETFGISIGGDSCEAIVCDENVSLLNSFSRVLMDCQGVDLSGNAQKGIPGPRYLPICPLA